MARDPDVLTSPEPTAWAPAGWGHAGAARMADAPLSDPYPQQETTLAGGTSGPAFFLDAVDRAGPTDNGKPSLTIDQAADQIVRDMPGWSAHLGEAFTVTYAFRADAPATMPDDTGGFQEFNAAQIAQATLALQAWSDVANITFVRVGSGTSGPDAYSDNATILFGDYSSGEDGAAAFTFFPGSTAPSSGDGDVWVNSTLSYNANPTVGNYGGQVLVHELGHAIGLDHPSDYNAEADLTLTYQTDASYYEDDRQYSVMSYFSETNTGGYDGGLYSAAPLMDDIAAAQLEYGANMTTRTGDTVYGFNSNTGQPWFKITGGNQKAVFAVWDAGGNDTLDFSGYHQAQTIDLNAGNFSSVGGLSGNVSIAEGVTIENAIGGSGDDSIVGNAANNSIQGNAGNDTVMAGSGNDTIDGGDGVSYLRGEDGDDSIQGGAGFDDINGNKGNDTIQGDLTVGSDWLVGGQNNDSITAHAGANLLYGNLGNDTLQGGTGADILRGGQGDDIVFAGSGNQFLSGDRGDDTITAGSGNDTVHSSQDAGIDRILGYNPGHDVVELDPGTTYTVTQVGADTVITMLGSPGNNEVVLVGVQMSTLPSNWIFVG